METFGKLIFVGEGAGQAQTVKLGNNMIAAAVIGLSAEALAMGVKAGVDPKIMCDVINISSGRNSATQDKFPRAVLTGTFDFGFTTGLSYKDVRLCVEEAEALGVPMMSAAWSSSSWPSPRRNMGPIRISPRWSGSSRNGPASRSGRRAECDRQKRPGRAVGAMGECHECRGIVRARPGDPQIRAGPEFVEKSIANATDFNRPLQELVTEYCWGVVWGREELPRRDRSLINLAMISALNRPHELKLHVKGALRNGLSRQDIREVLLQVAIYCGVPAAVNSFRVATEALAEFDKEEAK